MCNMLVWDLKESTPAVSHVRDIGGVQSEDAMELSYGCSLGRQNGLTSRSTAGKKIVLGKQIKRDAQGVESGSEPDYSHEPADDQEPARMSTEVDGGQSEDSSMGG